MAKKNSPASQAALLDDPLVFTPGGRRPRSHVHRIRRGERIERVVRESLMRRVCNPGPPDSANWITYASWTKPSAEPTITSMSSTWVVPPPPANAATQLIYLFNGLEPADGSMILQPVLQWGDSGTDDDGVNRTGNFWTIASWLVFGSYAHHTTHRPVASGTSLTGVIKLAQCGPGGFIYSCGFEGFDDTWYATPEIGELTWCSHTLEAYELATNPPAPYDLNSADEYPQGATRFRSINIATANGPAVGSWQSTNVETTSGQNTQLIVNSSSNGAIDIDY